MTITRDVTNVLPDIVMKGWMMAWELGVLRRLDKSK